MSNEDPRVTQAQQILHMHHMHTQTGDPFYLKCFTTLAQNNKILQDPSLHMERVYHLPTPRTLLIILCILTAICHIRLDVVFSVTAAKAVPKKFLLEHFVFWVFRFGMPTLCFLTYSYGRV